jgi:hypothetical protein
VAQPPTAPITPDGKKEFKGSFLDLHLCFTSAAPM